MAEDRGKSCAETDPALHEASTRKQGRRDLRISDLHTIGNSPILRYRVETRTRFGRLAQRESIAFTRRGSQVQIL